MKKNYKISQIKNDSETEIVDEIIEEYALTIILDEKLIVNLICSPDKINYLVIGYLINSNLITNKNISKIEFINNQVIVNTKNVSTSNNFIAKFDKLLNTTFISKQMLKFQNMSKLFQETGGVHFAAIFKNGSITFSEDISRHCAIDKAVGEFVEKKQTFEDSIIFLSSRVSSEIINKIKDKIAVVISKSAPTDKAIEMCKKYDITLIGFVRGNKMNIYTQYHKLTLKNKEEDI